MEVTSMEKARLRLRPAEEMAMASRKRKMMVERRTVERMSVMKVAVTTLRLRLRAKNRKQERTAKRLTRIEPARMILNQRNRRD